MLKSIAFCLYSKATVHWFSERTLEQLLNRMLRNGQIIPRLNAGFAVVTLGSLTVSVTISIMPRSCPPNLRLTGWRPTPSTFECDFIWRERLRVLVHAHVRGDALVWSTNMFEGVSNGGQRTKGIIPQELFILPPFRQHLSLSQTFPRRLGSLTWEHQDLGIDLSLSS